MEQQYSEELKVAVIKRLTKFQEMTDSLYDTVTRDNCKENYELYYADEEYYERKFPNLSKSSKMVSNDVHDTIEWALPSLLRIFFGSDQIITIQGRDKQGNDDKRAEILQQLIQWQLEKKNDAFLVFYNWFKDALITGAGILKCYWVSETKEEEQSAVLSAWAIQNLAMNPNITIVSAQPKDEMGLEYDVTYTTTIPVVSEPRIENIPASEFRYLPKTKNIKDTPYCAHKKKVTLDYLRRMEKEGIYANIAQVEEGGQKASIVDDDLDNTIYSDEEQSISFLSYIDDYDKEYELWEQYVDIDMNGDGITEKWIFTTVGDVIIRMEPNKYKRPPFFILSPTKDPHRLWVKRSYAKLIGQLQDLKVALIRQLTTAIAISNSPKMVVDEESINIYDLIEGKNWIRKKPGVPMDNAVYQIQNVQLHPWTFNLLEYVEEMKMNTSGITKYTQGLDAKSLNKTATGISAIMSASNQRLELIARIFAETDIKDLYEFLIFLNQNFLNMETMLRLTNEVVPVDPSDIYGEFDLIVSAGIGMGTKEAKLQNMQAILTTQVDMLKLGVPVVTPDDIYSTLKRMYEEMGEKNTQQFISTPMEVMMYQQQMTLMNLPPELQQAVMSGQITVQEAQMLMQGVQNNVGQGNPPARENTPNGGNQQGGNSQANPNIHGRMVGERERLDNRTPQEVPR